MLDGGERRALYTATAVLFGAAVVYVLAPVLTLFFLALPVSAVTMVWIRHVHGHYQDSAWSE